MKKLIAFFAFYFVLLGQNVTAQEIESTIVIEPAKETYSCAEEFKCRTSQSAPEDINVWYLDGNEYFTTRYDTACIMKADIGDHKISCTVFKNKRFYDNLTRVIAVEANTIARIASSQSCDNIINISTVDYNVADYYKNDTLFAKNVPYVTDTITAKTTYEIRNENYRGCVNIKKITFWPSITPYGEIIGQSNEIEDSCVLLKASAPNDLFNYEWIRSNTIVGYGSNFYAYEPGIYTLRSYSQTGCTTLSRPFELKPHRNKFRLKNVFSTLK